MTSVRGRVIAAAVFAGAFLLWNVLAAAISALLLLFTAILLAEGRRPGVEGANKRIPFGAAVGVVFGATLLVVVILGFVLLQPLGAELGKLLAAPPRSPETCLRIELHSRRATLRKHIFSHSDKALTLANPKTCETHCWSGTPFAVSRHLSLVAGVNPDAAARETR
jgi:hypothetical protein